MPERENITIFGQIRRGEAGIQHIKRFLCKVDAESAEAFDPRDEQKVKALIRTTMGFEDVNSQIKRTLVAWIGTVVIQLMNEIVERKDEE